MIFIKKNRQFTNKEELEYPTEDDFVDVKILNNNTKILSEKKANIDSLIDVARESEPKAIENAVKNIRNDISQNLQGVAKERSEYSIENKLQEVDTKVGNINSGISQRLQGVAKERSEYSIENKVAELDRKIENIEKLRNWITWPNLKTKIADERYLSNIGEIVILDITGEGYLIHSAIQLTCLAKSRCDLKIILDGKNYLGYDLKNENSSDTHVVEFGLYNLDILNSKFNGVYYDLGNGRYGLNNIYDIYKLNFITNKKNLTFTYNDRSNSPIPLSTEFSKLPIHFKRSCKIIINYTTSSSPLNFNLTTRIIYKLGGE